jgi:hypothetical protein
MESEILNSNLTTGLTFIYNDYYGKYKTKD